ncbi:MAG: CgeB family protein [Pyrinomonadaceae bacterium]
MRRLGHNVLDVDEEDYVSWRPQGLRPKTIRRLFSRAWVQDYNRAVLAHASTSCYDFILSYKGNSLKPETVRQLCQSGQSVYNFYPDVSFEDHGPNIPATIGLYDCVFTTKSYHGLREVKRFGIKELRHVRHGFDPEVHRPIRLSREMERHYGAEVSFVGCWSPEKEAQLLYVLKQLRGVVIKVYGLGWNYASREFRQTIGSNLKSGVFGDELSIVYCASKVNLGLLSAGKSDGTLQDQTTARTFQIPATGSFMLHPDTVEVRALFAAGEEVALFRSNEEMMTKITKALSSTIQRKAIAKGGYKRCLSEPYDYSSAAQSIINHFEVRESCGEYRKEHQKDVRANITGPAEVSAR